MNPFHSKANGQFTSKSGGSPGAPGTNAKHSGQTGGHPTGSKGAGGTGQVSSPGSGNSVTARAPKLKPVSNTVAKPKMKTLRREGNVSVRGGSSKEMYKATSGGLVSKGVKTVFSPDALKATLHRVSGANKKNPYSAATIVTQRGAFQASVGKKMFHGGSVHAQSLARPSIGKGFHMTPRGR